MVYQCNVCRPKPDRIRGGRSIWNCPGCCYTVRCCKCPVANTRRRLKATKTDGKIIDKWHGSTRLSVGSEALFAHIETSLHTLASPRVGFSWSRGDTRTRTRPPCRCTFPRFRKFPASVRTRPPGSARFGLLFPRNTVWRIPLKITTVLSKRVWLA